MPNGQPRIRTESHENQLAVDLKQVDQTLDILKSTGRIPRSPR